MHKRILRRKKFATQENWLKVWNNIEDYVSREHIEQLTQKTLLRMHDTIQGKVAYGWSGGKDALVVQSLSERMGIDRAVMIYTEIEYSDFDAFVAENKPDYMDVIYTRHNWDWLAEHEDDYLFPKEYKYFNNYLNQGYRPLMNQYFHEHNLDQMIVGQRRADNNHCPTVITTNAKGYTRNNIIYDWSHEECLAYLRYNGIELPKNYFYEDGFNHGTGPWWKALRKEKTLEEAWDYVYKHDPLSVIKASDRLKTAKRYLEGK